MTGDVQERSLRSERPWSQAGPYGVPVGAYIRETPGTARLSAPILQIGKLIGGPRVNKWWVSNASFLGLRILAFFPTQAGSA